MQWSQHLDGVILTLKNTKGSTKNINIEIFSVSSKFADIFLTCQQVRV